MSARSGPNASVIPNAAIERRIYRLRGANVMLSAELAEIYGVEPRALVQAVKRNASRFPDDFMFQLSESELGWYTPRPMRSRSKAWPCFRSVLRSDRAVQVNIEIVRAFVRLRQMLASHEDLARKLDALERKYDAQFNAVFDAIRGLMAPSEPSRRRIGLRRDE